MDNVLTVYRHEDKYLIPYTYMAELMNKFDKILKKDNNCIDRSYSVRSLYFDTVNNIDFYEKLAGTKVRKKIRLRVYDYKSDKCKLEMKKKDADLSHKISIWITKEDVKELVNGNYGILNKYFDKEEAIEIYKTMSMGCYKPVAMIEYDRIAYTYPLNDIRLTFDFNIRSSESNFDLFSDKIMYNNIMNDQVILEVKYNGKLMGFISDMLKPYKLTKTSVSKYCFGRINFYDFNY